MRTKTWTATEVPFVGRQDVLKLYRESLLKILNYEGRVILISGIPGIGKTRTIQQFSNITDNELIYIFSTSIEPNISLSDFFVHILNIFLNRPFISEAVRAVFDDELYAIYTDRFPFLKSVFPYEPLKKPNLDITPERVFRFLNNLATIHPLVILIDDFHNADYELKNLINLLVNNIQSLPVLLVLGCRPEQGIISWINRLKPASPLFPVELPPLTGDDIEMVNRVMFKNELPEQVFSWIYERTRGNPLFTREFIFHLIRQGIIYFDTNSNRWRITKLYKHVTFPETLEQMVNQKLSQLTTDALRLIKIASLISTEEFAMEMVNLEVSTKAIDEILHLHLLFKHNNRFRFLHPLIKEIVYDTISSVQKRKLHNDLGNYLMKKGMTAEAINQFMLARRDDMKLLKILEKEIESCKKNKEYQRALRYEEYALNVLSTKRDLLTIKMIPLFVNSANSLRRIGRFSDAMKYYNIAAGFLEKSQHRKAKKLLTVVYKDQTYAELRLGNYHNVIDLAEKVKRLYKRYLPDAHYFLSVESNRAFACADMGRYEEALEIALRLKSEFGNTRDLNQQFRIHYCITMVYFRMEDWQKTIYWCNKTLAIARKIGDERYIAAMCGNLGIAYMLTARFEEAEKYLLLHQNTSIANGWKREEFVSYLNFGNFYFFQGYLNRAEEEFKKALTITEGLGFKPDLINMYSNYAYFLIFKNDFKTSTTFLNKAMEVASKMEGGSINKSHYVYQGFIQALNGESRALSNTIGILQEKIGKKNENQEDYLLLKGFAELEEEKKSHFIEKGLEIVIKNNDVVKLVQMLIICRNVFGRHKGLKKQAQEYENRAIRYAKEHNMMGWIYLLMPSLKRKQTYPLNIYTFGKLIIELPDKILVREKEWQWAKPRQLFTILLSAYLKDQRLTRDQIGAMLWPELAKDKLVNNFHVCLNQLKSVIGKEYIEYEERNYRLANVNVDAKEFINLVSEAEKSYKQGKMHTAEYLLNNATNLYKEKYLEDFYDDWNLDMREYLYGRFRQAGFLLADIYLKKANTQKAIDIATKILLIDPLDEEAHRLLMSAYIEAGQKARAVEQYKRCEAIFIKELGCEPSEKTRALYHCILK